MMKSPILQVHIVPVVLLNPLDAQGVAADNGCAEFNSSAEIGLSNKLADKPLYCGIFTSVHATVASFMAGVVGALSSASVSNLPIVQPCYTCHPDWTRGGGLFNPKLEAFIMPKHARIFLTYSLVAITTLAIERNTPIAVIALSLAALVLVHVIGGTHHAK